MKSIHILTILGALAGGGFLLISFSASTSAPQEAAGAAIAVALAVIPYCFARGIELMSGAELAELRHLQATVAQQTQLLEKIEPKERS